ncbi:protogenin B-like [Trichogramma pretiosum]|uniref:protogenin B-like n=1 Tax=Trichogramma pretiosum TaxID=7493 RepID=UPI000C718F8B|nr:protogenin B-like [Trichogramma pretiosum]
MKFISNAAMATEDHKSASCRCRCSVITAAVADDDATTTTTTTSGGSHRCSRYRSYRRSCSCQRGGGGGLLSSRPPRYKYRYHGVAAAAPSLLLFLLLLLLTLQTLGEAAAATTPHQQNGPGAGIYGHPQLLGASSLSLSSSSSRTSRGTVSTAGRLGLDLEVRPRGPIILGPGARRSVTLTCQAGAAVDLHDVRWITEDDANAGGYSSSSNSGGTSSNNATTEESSLCHQYPTARCTIVHGGSLRVHKKKDRPSASLSNEEAAATDKAIFRCVAHTSFGEFMQSPPITVYFAQLSHAFKESPKDSTVSQGEVARLSCSIDSVPFPPNVTWLHDGQIISQDHPDNKYAFSASRGVLFVSSVEPSDAGAYRCSASNEHSKEQRDSPDARLTVLERPEPRAPALYPQSAYEHAVLNGSDLTLVCAASGYPTPATTWTLLRTDKGNIKRLKLSSSSSGLAILKLSKITTASSGVYVCSMVNQDNDTTESQNVTVDVLVPPTIIKKPADLVHPNGRTARFECQAHGYPTPHIYWLRNAQNVTFNGRTTMYKKDSNKVELAVSATVPSDSGIYQCVAVNAAGEASAAGRLQVNSSRNSPDAPTSLKCEARSPTKMYISWERPKLLPFTDITAYTVHYRPLDGGKEEVTPPEPGNSTSVEVSKHLEPFTNYTFYVRLWNNHGASDQSSTITCSTEESVPKIVPKTHVRVISSTKVYVTWKPLTKKEAQGIVTQYKLEWKQSKRHSVNSLILPSNVDSKLLTNLIPGEQYDFRVLARTRAGWSSFSESPIGWLTITIPTSQDLIQAQISMVESQSLKLLWSVKDPILEYTSWKIHIESQDRSLSSSIELPKNVSEYIFTNLKFHVPYDFKLCAIYKNEIVQCITKRADLSETSENNIPKLLEAISVSSTSISLSWLPAKLNVIESYELCYHAINLENQTVTCLSLSNTSHIVVKNLKPYHLYEFKVRVISNDTEKNNFSERVTCYTNEDVPGKIENIEWSQKNKSTIHVTWQKPSEPNGVIKSYEVAYTSSPKLPQAAWNNITIDGNITRVDLTGLLLGKKYSVIIRAATRAGLGSFSNPIEVFTVISTSESKSFDEAKPVYTFTNETKLGVLFGLGISLPTCILICLSTYYCRRKYENRRLSRESAQSLKNVRQTIIGRTSLCCADRSSSSYDQTTMPSITTNEIELAEMYSDSKGLSITEGIEPCVKVPLLSPWEINGIRKDLNITENPQYKLKSIIEQNNINTSMDRNDTQITQCSVESLNNNCARTHRPPVLEPNG